MASSLLLMRRLGWRARVARGFASNEATSAARSLNVFFGSQSGTAQSIAFGLSLSARSRDVECTVKALNEVDVGALDAASPAVIVISNFGVGEPPENAKVFVENLAKSSVACAAFCAIARWLSAAAARRADALQQAALRRLWARQQHVLGQLSGT